MSSHLPDFSAAHAVLQRQVDSGQLPGVSAATLRNGELLDSLCVGWANREADEALRPDHIYRAYSNTKLMTSVLAMMLVDEGRLALDEPLKTWIPAFANVRVLQPGAASLEQTEPLQNHITLRHLLSHQAGFGHGLLDSGAVIFDAYRAIGVRKPDTTLAELMARLATLPLTFQPGAGWAYSLATDVVARVIEIVTGQSFGQALQKRLFGPLDMVDTGHVLRSNQLHRLAPLYGGDPRNPYDAMAPAVNRLDDVPWPNAFVQPVPRQSGASGLVTTQADMLRLLQQLLPGRSELLKPETLAELMRDQLLNEYCASYRLTGAVPSLGFGLGGAVTRQTSALQPNSPVGEFQWGGLAGTHWWISPSTGVAGVVMTQRMMGFWNPFWFEYKQQVYEAFA